MRKKARRKALLEMLESMMERESAGGGQADGWGGAPDSPELKVVHELLRADYSSESRLREDILVRAKERGPAHHEAVPRMRFPGHTPRLAFAAPLVAAAVIGIFVVPVVVLRLGREAGGSLFIAPALQPVSAGGDEAGLTDEERFMRTAGVKLELPRYVPSGTRPDGVVVPEAGTVVVLYTGERPFVLQAVGSTAEFPPVIPVWFSGTGPGKIPDSFAAGRNRIRFSRIVIEAGVSYRIASSVLSYREMERILDSIRTGEE